MGGHLSFLAVIALVYCISILTVTFFPYLAGWIGLFFAGILLLARSRRSLVRFIIFLFVYIFGCGYVHFHNTSAKNDSIPFPVSVISAIGESQDKKEFVVKSERNSYKLYTPISSSLEPGDRIIAPDFFKPQSSGTPGVFDYDWYLKTQGFSGIIRLRDNSEIHKIGKNSLSTYQRLLLTLRRRLSESTTQGMSEDTAALLRGILLGEKREISPLLKKMFADTGVMHILAVSGLNVALVAAFFYFVFRNLFRLGKRPTSFLLIFILIIYGQIVGPQASVQRAVIMAIVGLTAVILERDKDMLNSISLAAFILLLMRPLQLFDVGFQLSFGATLGLIIITPHIQRLLNKSGKFISTALATTMGAQLAITPITIYYFHTFSSISVLANLVIVPLVGIITIVGFISFLLGLCLQPLGSFLIWCNHILLKVLILLVSFFHNVPFAFLYVAFPGVLMVVCYYLLLWGVIKKWNRSHVAISSAVLCGIVIFSTVFLPRKLTVSFVDVKQGDNIVIRTPGNKTILLDGGGGLDSRYNIGETIVAPFLWNQGIFHIDTIILSHVHYNHIQGLLPIIEKFSVGRVLIPHLSYGDSQQQYVQEFLGLIKEKKVYLQEWTGLKDIYQEPDFHMENVLNESTADTPDERSLIAKVIYKNTSFLLTSDNANVPNTPSHICQIPRHGKVPCTALPQAEIYVASSKVVPAEKKVFSTARDGTLTFTTDGSRLDIKAHK